MKYILIISSFFVLTSCHNVYKKDIDACAELCENNGGIEEIHKDLGDVVCSCENGLFTRFK